MNRPPKIILFFLSVPLFFLLSLVNSFPAIEKKFPFTTGEKITYAIKKMGVKAGEASLIFHGLTRIDNKEVYLIEFRANALNFLDEEKIYIDPKTFYPLIVKRDLNIWGKKEKISEEYWPEKGQVKITKNSGGKITEQTIEKKEALDNIYSFIYRYRSRGQFQIGDTLSMHLPTKDVLLKLKEITKLKAAGKQFEAYYMKSEPAQYEVWFDKSDKKIPLQINGAVGFGDTAMVMVKYQAR